MTLQYQRVVQISVDSTPELGVLSLGLRLQIAKLDVEFRVVKTLRQEPNTCELTIYNLSPDHRRELAQSSSAIVRVEAGYRGDDNAGTAEQIAAATLGLSVDGLDANVGRIFQGDVRYIQSTYTVPDWVTHLESGDGEKAIRKSRINRSFVPGTPLAVVIAACAEALGLGIGNTTQVAASAQLLGAGNQYLNGVVLSGPAAKELNRVVKSSGLDWSIADGVIQILKPGVPLADLSVVLTPTTGLVGAPTVGSDGVMRCRALINSNIVPGRQIEIEAKAVKGRFIAERCEYKGSNFTRDFYVDIEATEL